MFTNMNILNQLSKSTNNFDILRLFGAFLVFFGHAILINGGVGIFRWSHGLTISAIGVNIFFIISGFLITKSWQESHNSTFFLIKRFLRIYPGLIVAGALTVFIVGPLTTFLSTTDYIKNGQIIHYSKDILFLSLLDIRSNVLPGVFVTNKLPLIVNASLWTIPIEIMCYFFILISGFIGLLKRKRYFLYLSLIFVILDIILSTLIAKVDGLLAIDIIRLVTYFIIGMTMYLYREQIRISKILIIVLFILFLISLGISKLSFIGYLTFPAIILYIAMIKTSIFKKILSHGDFSYGFYLFAFPIQQSTYFFLNNKVAVIMQITISFFITLILAILSWNLVEKKFIDLKKYYQNYCNKIV